MLTLPRMQWVAPARLTEALELLGENAHRAAGDGDVAARRGPVLPVAGGTDVVPNLKHRLLDVETLVSLQRLPEPFLRGVRVEGDSVHIGALTSVADAAADPLLQATHPGLARAYSLVASPQIRNMGTVGGNLCLDTRCTYYNQTPFWRQALGFCLKREGTKCHVVPGGTRCVAASSSDGATMLLALGAEARVASRDGEKWLPVDDFFLGEGRRNLRLGADELVLEVRVPKPANGQSAAYEKLRPRAAIDFPALAVAVVARRDKGGALEALRVVVAALGAKPRLVAGLEKLVAGRRPDADLVRQVAEAAAKQCHPLTNISIDTEWRHAMVPVFVRRALAQALGDAVLARPKP